MNITASNPREQNIIDRVREAGQAHVFKFWEELDAAGQQRLLQQLGEIDFDLLSRLKRDFIDAEDKQLDAVLEPANFIPVPETPEQQANHKTARDIGEEALRAGHVAAFLVAGGQGTRLGFAGPKGKFPISPIRQKSLFQLHAEKILALSRKYGVTIPWYIMTSEANHKETVAFFEEHGYFGLKAQDVMFFRQDMIPALDSKGRLFLDKKDHIFKNPNGHGGALSALKNSGALDDMKQRGIDIVFYFQVDNVLIKMCDPIFIGYHLRDDAQMSAKVVQKTDPAEKVGVIGYINGNLGVIEYSDLPEEQQNARNPDGTLKFRGGSIAIHVFDVDFIEQENTGGLRLPWHVAHKKIPYLDDQGNLVEPDAPNGYKFETFVFDALGDAERAVFLEVSRKEEFSPVKNAEGTDSPETARSDQIDLFANWLGEAGIEVPRDINNHVQGKIEISPLYALDAAEVRAKVDPDLKFDGKLYLA